MKHVPSFDPQATPTPRTATIWLPAVAVLALLAVGWAALQSTLDAPPWSERSTLDAASAEVAEVAPSKLRLERPVSALLPDNDLHDDRLSSYWGVSLETISRLQHHRNLSNDRLALLTPGQFHKQVTRLDHPKPDHPGEAMAWRMMRHRDENGRIRPDGLINAIRQREAQLKRQSKARVAGVPTSATPQSSLSPNSRAGITPTGWTWLGPGNVGGRTRAVIIAPTSSSTYFAGSVGGGIWKSTNSGATWTPLDGFSANLACTTLVARQTSPTAYILYAGTGEGFFNGDALRGAGIFVSTNAGNTWTQLSSTNNSNFHYVNRIAISPNGSVLLAATNSGLYRSTDGGATWTTPSGGVNTRMLDVDFHPTDSTRCVCSTSGARVWYSTNGGAAFTASTGLSSTTNGFSERAEVCYATANPSVVYASVDRSNGSIFRSTDGGATFTLRSTVNYLSGQGWYDNVIWAGDPTSSDRVLVGGIDLWRSTDGGATLTRISDWTQSPLSAHADHHAIFTPAAYNGTSNQTLLFGNDGGVYRGSSVFGTVAWQELNNNYGVTQFYGGSGNATSGVFYGGTQDNGTLQYTGNTEGWIESFGGDGGFSASDPTDPNYHYGEYVYLTIHRSSNGGTSANFIYSGISDANNSNTALFIAPFILDPSNPDRMLAGGASLWRSNNVKAPTPTWASIKSAAGGLISAIAVNPLNSDQIWVGHTNGDLWYTTNGTTATPTWNQMDGTTLPNRYLERIAVDPMNGNTVYVSFGSFSTGNLWKTTDAGATWIDISAGLPSAPINGIAVHPTNSNWVYVGSEVGVYASDDGGASWNTSNDGPVNVAVDEVTFVGNRLLAVTHGRGMYTIVPSSGGGGGGGGVPTNIASVAWNAANRTLTITGDANPNSLTATWRTDRVVLTSSGDTRIRNGTSYSTSVTINTGKGNVNIAGDLQGGDDSLSIISMPVGTISTRFGDGNDRLTVSYCRITRTAADGGPGTNSFVNVGSTITTNANISFP